MDVLRTPEERFAELPDYPFVSQYLDVPDPEWGSLRMHYVDEGPVEAPVVLMLHGEPSWSFAWRKVITAVVAAGYRAVAPDHIGFGKSEKLPLREHYSQQRFIAWMNDFVRELDLDGITLVCQDWGGPIGLGIFLAGLGVYYWGRGYHEKSKKEKKKQNGPT